MASSRVQRLRLTWCPNKLLIKLKRRLAILLSYYPRLLEELHQELSIDSTAKRTTTTTSTRQTTATQDIATVYRRIRPGGDFILGHLLRGEFSSYRIYSPLENIPGGTPVL